jgi:hypothetical protein
MKWRSDATNANPAPRREELAAGVQAGLRARRTTTNQANCIAFRAGWE